MTSVAPTLPALDYAGLRTPHAVFEVLAYLTLVASAILAFVTGWLTVNAAVVITVILLSSLIILSWINLGEGHHPVFLVLGTLTLFQGGRLSIGRANEGIVLLCLALSAICLYVPCRWNYKAFPPPDTTGERKYLPYLYLLFPASLPVQLYNNYKYFQWVQQHVGLLVDLR